MKLYILLLTTIPSQLFLWNLEPIEALVFPIPQSITKIPKKIRNQRQKRRQQQETNSFSNSIYKNDGTNKNVKPNKTKLKKNNDRNNVILNSNEQQEAENVDAMRARAGKLRNSILRQQIELQKLERQIICCSSTNLKSEMWKSNDSNNNTIWYKKKSDDANLGTSFIKPTTSTSISSITATNAIRRKNNLSMESSTTEQALEMILSTIHKFQSSSQVLTRKLSRVESKRGPKNAAFHSVADYIAYETAAGARIVSNLVQKPSNLWHLMDPETPTLAPHLPAILARLDQLEYHVEGILERVLNNKRHLPSIEPYLDQVLERFDDIEPHLEWILDNIDALAPYTGLLLKHIDELLLYAEADEYESFKDQYDLAEQLLPYLEYYVSRLDSIGPHLPLLRPHVPQLLRHNRIGKISPHIDRLFIKGYTDLSASANMDVLLFWFGWTLRIPGLPKLFFALPGSPKIVSFLANRLPRRFVRGYCSDVTCLVDNEYGGSWNKLSK